MSTGKNKILDEALGDIPVQFRSRIIKQYIKIKERHAKEEYDASGLSCGKLCEEILRFLQHKLTGTHIGFSEEIKNFKHCVDELEKVGKSIGNDSLRIIIPRALCLLYTFRNKRNIGHSGGDVDSNAIDSKTIDAISDWVICELIRIFYKCTIEDAQNIVNIIAVRNLPQVWEVNGKKRVLATGLSAKEKVLLLTYSQETEGVFFEDLFSWVEYPRSSDFKTKVLEPLHKEGLIEFDKELNMIFISPKGCKQVEDDIILIDN
jgi:hypothetical protein